MKYLPITSFHSLALLLGLTMFFVTGCAEQQQERFGSPDHAASHLVKAMREGSNHKLEHILGPDADDVIFSGDEVADRNGVKKFLHAYDEKHQLIADNEKHVTLVIGKNDWPLPIPIVKDEKNKWYFDTAAGEDEIINRRIGQNELDVIEVCRAIVDAQHDYSTSDADGDGVPQYAEKFISDAGKKNGLYWPTAEGEKESPLGPLVADAVDEGYGSRSPSADTPRPYHGYCFRMLKSQGPGAPGGAMDYVVNGLMIGGFAVIAQPADYGNSGIMSFMVSQQGVVYQKDLGPDTANVAKAIQSFDPSDGWQALPADAAAPAADNKP